MSGGGGLAIATSADAVACPPRPSSAAMRAVNDPLLAYACVGATPLPLNPPTVVETNISVRPHCCSTTEPQTTAQHDNSHVSKILPASTLRTIDLGGKKIPGMIMHLTHKEEYEKVKEP